MLNDLMDRGVIHTATVSKSVAPHRRFFASLITGAGVTISTGEGQTTEDALQDAVDRLGRAPTPTTQPSMPTFTRG